MFVRHYSIQELPGAPQHAPFPTAPSRVACLPEYFMYCNNLKRLGTRQYCNYLKRLGTRQVQVVCHFTSHSHNKGQQGLTGILFKTVL